jgi:hypothetical protein
VLQPVERMAGGPTAACDGSVGRAIQGNNTTRGVLVHFLFTNDRFYRDGLGTNIQRVKLNEKTGVFQARFEHMMRLLKSAGINGISLEVRQTPLFVPTFYIIAYKMIIFTKTGSGHTQEKPQKFEMRL